MAAAFVGFEFNGCEERAAATTKAAAEAEVEADVELQLTTCCLPTSKSWTRASTGFSILISVFSPTPGMALNSARDRGSREAISTSTLLVHMRYGGTLDCSQIARRKFFRSR
jgi:hypothetical protein